VYGINHKDSCPLCALWHLECGQTSI
jgi:hypothetical protein